MIRDDFLVCALVVLICLAMGGLVIWAAVSSGCRSHVSAHHGGHERRIDVPDGYRFVGIFSDESDGTFNVYVEYEKEAER